MIERQQSKVHLVVVFSHSLKLKILMKKNNIEKWETEIKDFPKEIFVEGLHDNYEGFRLVVRGGKPSRVYRISFDCHVGYRNFDESERLKLNSLFPSFTGGWSLFVSEKSDFIDWLVGESFEVHTKKEEITHYYIATPNDIVEVLATCEPKIEKL